MLDTIWGDLKRQYYSGSMITRLLIINLAVFLSVRFLWLGLFLAGQNTFIDTLLNWISISAKPFEVITRPWTIITNMFLHFDVSHILWNMLFLYWFGRILEELIGSGKVLAIYIISGLAGALAFFLGANLLSLGIGSYALGASGAIMGIILAAATLAPHYQIHMLFIGGVKLMYVALFVVILDLISIPSGFNTGGHLAHLGGAAMGFFLATQMQKGNGDWVGGFNRIFAKITNWFQSTFTQRPKPKVSYKNPNKPKQKPRASSETLGMTKEERQKRVDMILDKIKKEGGYDNLTAEEKEFLFRVGRDD